MERLAGILKTLLGVVKPDVGYWGACLTRIDPKIRKLEIGQWIVEGDNPANTVALAMEAHRAITHPQRAQPIQCVKPTIHDAAKTLGFDVKPTSDEHSHLTIELGPQHCQVAGDSIEAQIGRHWIELMRLTNQRLRQENGL
jgi:hypothetical protein